MRSQLIIPSIFLQKRERDRGCDGDKIEIGRPGFLVLSEKEWRRYNNKMRRDMKGKKNAGKQKEECKNYSPEDKPKKYTYKKWDREQNIKYGNFLKEYLTQMLEREQNHLQKQRNLFMRMAEFIGGTRNNEQCRTHHVKSVKKFKTIPNIIASIDLRFPLYCTDVQNSSSKADDISQNQEYKATFDDLKLGEDFLFEDMKSTTQKTPERDLNNEVFYPESEEQDVEFINERSRTFRDTGAFEDIFPPKKCYEEWLE